MTRTSVSFFISTFLLLSPGLQAGERAASPFVGRWHWDGPETCAAKYAGDTVAMQIKPTEIVFYESTCKIRGAKRLGDGSLGDNAYRFSLLCRGEGVSNQTATIFSLVSKSKLAAEMLIRLEPASGFTQIYYRCP